MAPCGEMGLDLEEKVDRRPAVRCHIHLGTQYGSTTSDKPTPKPLEDIATHDADVCPTSTNAHLRTGTHLSFRLIEGCFDIGGQTDEEIPVVHSGPRIGASTFCAVGIEADAHSYIHRD